MNASDSTLALSFEHIFSGMNGEAWNRDQLRTLVDVCRRIIARLKIEADSLRYEMTSVAADLFGPNVMFALRNRQGFTKEEAKKLFYNFRSGGQKDPEEDNPEKTKPDPAKGVVDAKTTEDKIDQIVVYMRETSNKLDRIEDDINFLKEQVDRILEKL